MRSILVITAVLSLCLVERAVACGGGGSVLSSRSSGFGGFSNTAAFSGPTGNLAMAGAQINAYRQQAAIAAAAHRARMYPVRLANATKAREQRLAQRKARTQVRIAKLEAKRRAEQEFLANSRTWKDSTGEHQLRAILVKASDRSVQLRKSDGSSVSVPLARLSTSDQSWIASNATSKQDSDAVMLAGLWK